MKNTVATLAAMKRNGEKISQLTCYDYSTAKLIDAAGINMILVGDSLGMTMQGYKDTLPVTVDEMIVYGRSVVRGCQDTFVVVDMPFMSYQISVEQAMQNAGRIMKETGASAVKLEGGKEVCPQIRAITAAGIPVVAHIGMTPQSVNAFGGFTVQGKGEANARRVLEDALAVQEAGAFAVTLECVPPKLFRAHHEKARHHHHRYRRFARVRRAGVGLAGYARHFGLQAQIRQAFGRGGRDHARGVPRL